MPFFFFPKLNILKIMTAAKTKNKWNKQTIATTEIIVLHITGVKFKETICCTPIGRPQPNRRQKKGNLLQVCNAYNTENYLSKQNFSNIKNVCKYCSHIFFSCVFVCVCGSSKGFWKSHSFEMWVNFRYFILFIFDTFTFCLFSSIRLKFQS